MSQAQCLPLNQSKLTSSDWDLLVSVYPVAIDRMSCITSKVFLDTAIINRTSVGESNGYYCITLVVKIHSICYVEIILKNTI